MEAGEDPADDLAGNPIGQLTLDRSAELLRHLLVERRVALALALDPRLLALLRALSLLGVGLRLRRLLLGLGRGGGGGGLLGSCGEKLVGALAVERLVIFVADRRQI